MTTFEEWLTATTTEDVPWAVVPAGNKDNTRLIVSRIVVDTLEALNMSYQKPTPERHRELEAIRHEFRK